MRKEGLHLIALLIVEISKINHIVQVRFQVMRRFVQGMHTVSHKILRLRSFPLVQMIKSVSIPVTQGIITFRILISVNRTHHTIGKQETGDSAVKQSKHIVREVGQHKGMEHV